MMNCKVLGFGSPILDFLARVDDAFLTAHVSGEKGGMVMLDASEQQTLIRQLPGDRIKKALGGSAFNTISALISLGVSCAFLGKLGTDENGAYCRRLFAGMGGDASRLRTGNEAPTATCLSLVTPDSERTMRTHFGIASLLRPEEISDADFEGITHVHIEGYLLFLSGVVEKAMELAKKHGCTVSFDLASFEVVRIFRDRIRNLLEKYVDIVFANEDEAREFCQMEFTPETAAAQLRHFCSVAAVKLGRKGAYLQSENETASIEPRLVKAVDTTGAGDLWQAGFLYGFLNGCSLQKSGEMGSIMGAEIVQVLGAEIPADRWDSIKQQFQQIQG